MKRSTLHLTVDGLMAFGAVGLILTGLLIEFVLPPGSRQASVRGWTRHDWGDVHFWFAMGILVAGVLHLVLHWGWVCSVTAKLKGVRSTKPTRYRKLWTGLVTASLLVVLVGGFLFAADAAKQADPGRQGLGQFEREVEDLFLGKE